MILATQYFRPPFPEKRFWEKDLDSIKDAGLNAIQLWVVWAWVEPEPGVFNYDDYDELFDEAEKRGLGVILSTSGELHPLWIHRVIPDSYMVDNMGNRVISSNRVETNQGLTPGGCTDNPEVLSRMRTFFIKTAERYANRANLIGWDCWNELRWNCQSDGLVCYCPYTINAFRNWLMQKYKDLENLNKYWKRRYCSWEDVFPGKKPIRPYTEMMEFQAFLQWRSAQHAKFRYDTIKSVDKNHLITAHGPQPSFYMAGDSENQVMNRGNDFDIAEQLDGYGCSHFPFWTKICDEDFGVRVEATKSAAAGKTIWVSELQGGAARQGFITYPSVRGEPQQRWVWNGFARGAKAVIFWCWRDEVFGKESSGFGIAGFDGYADERLRLLKKTSDIIAGNQMLLDNYHPDEGTVGVFFDPNTYNLEWSQDGAANRSRDSINGYLTALERIQVSYEIIETSHMKALDHLKVLIMPWPLVVPPDSAKKIIKFVKDGGTLLIEGEADAYTTNGFYKYPGEEREFSYSLGIEDLGRRALEDEIISLTYDGEIFNLKVQNQINVSANNQIGLLGINLQKSWDFFTPLKDGGNLTQTEVLSKDSMENILAIKNKVGKGTVISLGNFIGKIYNQEWYEDFEKFVRRIIVSAGVSNEFEVSLTGTLQWKTGISNNSRLFFIMNSGCKRKVVVKGNKENFGACLFAEELQSNVRIPIIASGDSKQFEISVDEGAVSIIKWDLL